MVRFREIYLKRLNKSLEQKVTSRTETLLIQQQEIEQKNNILTQNNAELLQKNEEIKTMAEQLQEAHQAKMQFFTNISHEFRTPLTLILAPIQKWLQQEQQNELVTIKKQPLGRIESSAEQLLWMVDELLKIRKSENASWSFSPEDTLLSTYFEKIYTAFTPLAEQQNIQYHLQLDIQTDSAVIDPHMIKTILNNLLSNAFKHTPENGEIAISITEPIDTLSISVYNTGAGIPTEMIDKVFERFFQINAQQQKGTGIGLSLVKRLVDLHNGTIKIESEEGKYARFLVKIPLLSSTQNNNITPAKQEMSSQGTLQKATELHIPKELEQAEILIVEDNHSLQEMLKEELGIYFQISTADNGLLALEKLNNHTPDLIISDVMMDEMDGFQFCEKVKTQPETSHIPVVLLTAMTSEEHQLEGIYTGADDYITKPFNLNLLIGKISNILKTRANLREKYHQNPFIEPKEFTVNPLDQKFLEKVNALIEKHLKDPHLEAAFLYKELGFGRSTFYRKMKALTGQSVNLYIRSIRLKRAAVLLRSGQNVTETFIQTGFGSMGYFSDSFKEQFGVSPSVYAKGEKG